MKLRKESHFGAKCRKTPLPADKKDAVRGAQKSTRRREEVTKRPEYAPASNKQEYQAQKLQS
jgi:hypothetical protein